MPIFQKPKKQARVDDMVRVPRRAPGSAFVVPSPADLIPDLAKLDAKTVEINEAIRADRAEMKLLERELAVDDSKEINPDVAAILGDAESTKSATRRKLAETRRRLAVADAALVEISKRRTVAASQAGAVVCAAVRPEAARLVAALCEALQAVDAVHQELGDLLLAVEAEGVSTGSLGQIRPFFLGDAREAERRVVTYLKEVRAAGYDV